MIVAALRLTAVILAMGMTVPAAAAGPAGPALPAANSYDLLTVDGIINAGSTRYIRRGLEGARVDGAGLVVIQLNTPGGLLSSTREIVQAIDASTVPVAVYVAPSGSSATSAGTIITMAAHYAVMAPGTNIGAAHPVGGQGEDIKGDLKKKAENDTVAFIKGQARLRARNDEWAEAAIRKSVSLPADEALAKHVVDLVAKDLSELLAFVAANPPRGPLGETKSPHAPVLASATPREIPMSAAERFLTFIGDPNVSYLLMTLGGLGIYVELTSPGVVLPGVLGVIALVLAFVSFSSLPVNTGGVVLLVIGLLLFGFEAFVPSYGALTLGGAAALILGALILVDPSAGDLRLSLALVLPTVLAMAALTLTIAFLAVRSRRQIYGGLTNFADYEGVVETLEPSGSGGKCHIRGETWDFELFDPRERVQIGEHLVVVERRGMRLVVKAKAKGD